MSEVEHKLLGDVLLWSLMALFGLALPWYWWLRRKSPEAGWNFGGNVNTVGLQSYDLVGVGAVICFVTLIWKGLEKYLGEAMPEVTVMSALANALTFLSIAAIVPAALFWRVNVSEFFGLRWNRLIHLWWIVPIFMALMLMTAKLLDLSGWGTWVQGLGGSRQASVQALESSRDIKLLGVMVFAAVFAAPIAEEFIFRGYVYPVVKRFTERNFATFFTAVLFGVAHFNLLGLPVLILFGIATVVVYEYTGSIWAPIACHMVFNGMQIGNTLGERILKDGGWEFSL